MQQDPPSEAPKVGDAPSILVVDDDEDSRRILMYGLGSHGYRVFVAENGAAAIDMCKSVHPDVVIMDLAMPEMDGYAAVRALKADPAMRDVPVIAWSARVFSGDAPEVLDAGFDEVLAKPALPADVIQAVRRHLPPTASRRAD